MSGASERAAVGQTSLITEQIDRTMILWCPDWPVGAARRWAAEHASENSAGAADADTSGRTAIGSGTTTPLHDGPLALIEHGEVFACDAAARAAGVRRGLRVREAQARCTELQVIAYDPVVDARAFEPVVAEIEQIMPGVQLLRPGICAIRSRGPSRYYGGEEQAADVLLERVSSLGIVGARVGIADGPFAAEYAARMTGTAPIGIVQPEASPAFLAPLPLDVLGQPELVSLLRRLGIRTLGAFAALPAAEVRDRFGSEGAFAHRLAAGTDTRRVVPGKAPKELSVSVAFEPALDRIDQIAFGFRQSADRFIEQIRSTGHVSTAITVTLQTQEGEHSTRTWLHPRWFTAADVLDRVRWQLQGSSTTGEGLGSPLAFVAIVPETLDAAGDHEEGLWGGGPDERIHHGLSRVQSMLGHTGVLTAIRSGGRMLADRRLLIPWGGLPPGGEAAVASARGRPWPGAIPGVNPATIFDPFAPATVTDDAGVTVDIDDRGTLTGPPANLRTEGSSQPRRIVAWAGPWTIDERWWDARQHRRLHRFQVVDEAGSASLLVLHDQHWFVEASYD
ncbi:DNA polymerase Y family protein [Plantibacter sp. Mn2098]|uniref:DNA polymerase Y family protein n=1 Tax=Plantibacter sp. Mn2098 TaxID=3395266 RepID=UPI003BD79F9E